MRIFRLFVKAKCVTHAKTTLVYCEPNQSAYENHSGSQQCTDLPSISLFGKKNQSMIETQKTFIFSVNKSLEIKILGKVCRKGLKG